MNRSNAIRRTNYGRNQLTVALQRAILDDLADAELAKPGADEKYPATFPAHLCDPYAYVAARVYREAAEADPSAEREVCAPPELAAGYGVTLDAGGA